MNTIVFSIPLVGKEHAGAYVRADEARARITELEKQLSRYQGGIKVEGTVYYHEPTGKCLVTVEAPRILLEHDVRVLVMKEVE